MRIEVTEEHVDQAREYRPCFMLIPSSETLAMADEDEGGEG
jgi:hypothetical protein